MRIFIAGATGVYGQAVIPRLLDRGDTVVALARDVSRVGAIARPGVELVTGDLLDGNTEQLTAAMHGCEAVLHLATAIRPGATGTEGANTTAALRTAGTRHLLDAVLAAGVPAYLQQSITMGYIDGGETWLDEGTPFASTPGQVTAISSVVDMEEMVRALDPQRVRWCILRGSLFVGPGTMQDDVLERLRAGTQQVPGDGSNWISFIHVEDIAEATLAAIDRAPAGSVFNITDTPVRNGDYLDRLAALLGVPSPPRDAEAPHPRSHRCSNEAASRILGWQPTRGIWPRLDEGA